MKEPKQPFLTSSTKVAKHARIQEIEGKEQVKIKRTEKKKTTIFHTND